MKFLRLKDVMERTGLSRSTVYRLMNEGAFPKSVQLGARTVAWVDQEIDDWVMARIDERDCA